jgi:hypothetical protein
MRTTSFGVLLVLGSIGALTVNGVAGCTYTAAGQGADAAPPSVENGDGGTYVGGEDGGGVTPPQGNDSSVSTGPCGQDNDCNGEGQCCLGNGGGACCPSGGVCCGSACCPATSGCSSSGDECGGGTVTCGPNMEPCGNGFCCPAPADASPGCSAGYTSCPDGCVDLQMDQNNCGNCGVVCPAGQPCTNGSCASCTPPTNFPMDCQAYANDATSSNPSCTKCIESSTCPAMSAQNGCDETTCASQCESQCVGGCKAPMFCSCMIMCAQTQGSCCPSLFDSFFSCSAAMCGPQCSAARDAGAP